MDQNKGLSIIILAAGKGTRMKSDKAKVLHEVCFIPMVQHVVNAVNPLSPLKTVVVVGHQHERVKNTLKNLEIEFALQEEQLGTGHAVLSAEAAIQSCEGNVLILYGDTPLIKDQTLVEMYQKHLSDKASLTIMTTVLEDPTNYGRILVDNDGKVSGIVEQKDASSEQQKIGEINAGIYCVDKEFLFQALKKVDTDNSQGEMYLTDIVAQAVHDNLKVEKYRVQQPSEVLGVNSRVELVTAHNELQMRRNVELMTEGVTIYSPETTFVSMDASIVRDTTIYGDVEITGDTVIGARCTVGKGTIIKNCTIGDEVVIGPYSYLVDANIETGTTISPYSKIQ